MNVSPLALLARARSSQKAIRYSLTSVVSVIVGQSLLTFFLVVPDWSARVSNIAAVSLSAIPSYLLNRYWAWGKRGRNHLFKEVLPFWGLALLGLAFSTFTVGYAEDHISRSVIVINGASLFAFGVLWVAKFVIFNEILFKHHPEVLDDEPALDGRTGLPT